VAHRQEMQARYPSYHNAPVPPFGDPRARLLIVGLAPGAHGANATGRPFTGDHAGILLYRTLHEAGFASAPESRPGDRLALRNCRITNAVKCLPPANKPMTGEVDACNGYLVAELAEFPADGVILALGAIAHRAVVRACGGKQSDYAFAHGAVHELPGGRKLVDSYHCSRYNTQTGRLTETMFKEVVARAAALL
jgi:uracil-DNA glycosylase family 4